MEKIKLYHIDRTGTMRSGQVVDLTKNIVFDDANCQKFVTSIEEAYYSEGLSSHGIQYLLMRDDFSGVLDIIFEYERLLNYSNKLSRYQSLFAFDIVGIKEFVKRYNLTISFYKIYEIEYDYCEKYNMDMIRGSRHFDTAALAKAYWENDDSLFNDTKIYEYLVKLPVRIGKEIRLEEIDNLEQ